jgi:hypothetical protein
VAPWRKEVVMSRRRSLPLSLAFLSVASTLAAQCELQELSPAGLTGSDGLGAAVALDGTTALIGASGHGGPGAVFVFERVDAGVLGEPLDDTWVETAMFMASDPSFLKFGSSLHLRGPLALVGAPGNGSSPSAVFEFWRDDNGTPADPLDDTWTETAKIRRAGAWDFDHFGVSLDLVGETLVVGADLKNYSSSTVPAKVYVFERDDGGTPTDPADDLWIETAAITASGTPSYMRFGHAVALDEQANTLVVGAYWKRLAYVFARDDRGTPLDPLDDTWVETAKLTGSLRYDRDFGYAVDIAGDTLAISMPDGNTSFRGGVDLLQRDDGGTPSDPLDDTWSFHSVVTGPAALTTQSFGASLVLEGDHLLVGDPEADQVGADAGRAHLFECFRGSKTGDPSDDVWLPANVFVESTPSAFRGFGGAVAMQGDRALIGSTGSALGYRGAAHAWSLLGAECALGTDTHLLSVVEGGTQQLHLRAGVANAGRSYLVLGSESGTSPGTFLGSLWLPLNTDEWFLFTLRNPNLSPLGNTEGQLDPLGAAVATISLPPGSDPSLAGRSFDHAFALIDAGTPFVSNPVSLLLHPVTPLVGSPRELSVAGGGTQQLMIAPGPGETGRTYLVLGTASGTTPGTVVGTATIPLNEDPWFTFTLYEPNELPLVTTLGVLSPEGEATAAIVLPPLSDPGLVGVTLHHAFVDWSSSLDFVSNAVPLELHP